MTNILYSLGAEIEDGASILKTATISATAYDLVSTTVAAEGTETVDVQPGAIGDMVIFMMTSDNYTSITYAIDGGPPMTLDGPLVLIGTGATALIGATCATCAIINGGTVQDANIQIFTARIAEA